MEPTKSTTTVTWQSVETMVSIKTFILIFIFLFIPPVTPTPTKPPVVSNCPTDAGKNCIFPFKDGANSIIRKCIETKFVMLGSTTHSECADYKGRKWCATSLKADGSYNGYGYCDMAKCGSEGKLNPFSFGNLNEICKENW